MDKLIALYTINKKAKQYLDSNRDRDITRGEILYKCKHKLLNEWIDEFERIEKHKIDGRDYYCLFSEDRSFHIPEDELYCDVEVSETKVLDDFSTTMHNEKGYSEKEALEYLHKEHSINPNNYVSRDAPAGTKWGFLPATFNNY